MANNTDKPQRQCSYAPMLVYVSLLALAIPWYWPPLDYSIWFGLPSWVVIAIVVSFFASAYTAWLLRKPWPGEIPDEAQH